MRLMILPVLLLVAGCTPPATGPALPGRCGPEFDAMVGRNIGEFTMPAGLAYRVVQPGASLTEDYNAERANIFVDAKGWVQKVECW